MLTRLSFAFACICRTFLTDTEWPFWILAIVVGGACWLNTGAIFAFCLDGVFAVTVFFTFNWFCDALAVFTDQLGITTVAVVTTTLLNTLARFALRLRFVGAIRVFFAFRLGNTFAAVAFLAVFAVCVLSTLNSRLTLTLLAGCVTEPTTATIVINTTNNVDTFFALAILCLVFAVAVEFARILGLFLSST